MFGRCYSTVKRRATSVGWHTQTNSLAAALWQLANSVPAAAAAQQAHAPLCASGCTPARFLRAAMSTLIPRKRFRHLRLPLLKIVSLTSAVASGQHGGVPNRSSMRELSDRELEFAECGCQPEHRWSRTPNWKWPHRRFWTNACPRIASLAVRSAFRPRMGRSRPYTVRDHPRTGRSRTDRCCVTPAGSAPRSRSPGPVPDR